jgi:hypothetical protein
MALTNVLVKAIFVVGQPAPDRHGAPDDVAAFQWSAVAQGSAVGAAAVAVLLAKPYLG